MGLQLAKPASSAAPKRLLPLQARKGASDHALARGGVTLPRLAPSSH